MEIIDGRFIPAGNKNLYAKITGSGAPAIIIETGLGSLSVEWQIIQNELSKYTTVISYDRAGYGESPTGEKPRSSHQIGVELFNMLSYSGVPSPYIFIGHSMGGIYVQHFSIMFPNLVAGVLLADSATVDDDIFNTLEAPVYQQSASLPVRIKNIEKFLELEDEEFQETINKILSNLHSNPNDELGRQLVVYQSDKKLYKTIIDE